MADDIPETLFEQIYRRAPSQADKDRLLGVKASLGLSDRDELWPLILTLDHYTVATSRGRRDILKAVEDLPAKVDTVVAKAENAATAKADKAIAKAVERGAETLTQIVVKRSRTTADRISKRQFVTAATIGGVIAVLCVGAGAAGGYIGAKHYLDICIGDTFKLSSGRTGCYLD